MEQLAISSRLLTSSNDRTIITNIKWENLDLRNTPAFKYTLDMFTFLIHICLRKGLTCDAFAMILK